MKSPGPDDFTGKFYSNIQIIYADPSQKSSPKD